MHSQLREFKANIFAALAHPIRIAIVDALRKGQVTAGELADRLDAEPSNLSQHLTVLRDREVVSRQKAGTQTYYSLRDPILLPLLDVLKRHFQSARAAVRGWLASISAEAPPGAAGPIFRGVRSRAWSAPPFGATAVARSTSLRRIPGWPDLSAAGPRSALADWNTP